MNLQEPVQRSPSFPTLQEGEEPIQFVYRIETQTQEKSRRLIQRQLILLLHAHNCQKKDKAFAAAYPSNSAEADDGSVRPKCPIQQCKNMKDVWEHMRHCTIGPECKFLHCASSLKILAHWKYCTTWECPVCHLIRLKGAQQVGAGLTMKAAETARALAPKQIHSTGKPQNPSQSPTPCTLNIFASNSLPNYNIKASTEEDNELYYMEQDQHLEENANDGNPDEQDDGIVLRGTHFNNSSDSNSRVPSADDVRQAYEQLGIPCPREALTRLMATLPGGQKDTSLRNQMNDEKEDLNECCDSGFVPDDGVPSIGAAADDVVQVQADEAEAESQQWRQSMSSIARERLVRQIHEAIFVSSGDLGMMGRNDPRLMNSITDSRQIELEAHHLARSRAEYYELISERINKACQENSNYCLRRYGIVTPVKTNCDLVSQQRIPQLQRRDSCHTVDSSYMVTESICQSSPKDVRKPQTILQLLEGYPCAGYRRRVSQCQQSLPQNFLPQQPLHFDGVINSDC